MEKQEILETIWEVPDDLWEEIEPIILEIDPPKHTGRKRVNPRQMLNGIIYRMRSVCQSHLSEMGRMRVVPSGLGLDSVSV